MKNQPAVTKNSSSSSSDPNSKQARMREKAEEINLVLLEPDVDLWKLRELALSEGGLVNDTIRRRAWPKLVGLTRSFNDDEDDVHERKIITVSSPPRATKPTVDVNTTAANMVAATPLPKLQQTNLRKGTAPHRVTNFGRDEDHNNPGTAFTGGPFDQHDTNATAALAEDDTTSLASFDSNTMLNPSSVMACQDAEQIERDVTRCTWHLLTGGQRSRRRVMANKHRKKISRILRRKQRRLGDLINLTLAMSELDLAHVERLCYFQGYHDVASIFLAALGGASSKAIQQHQQQQQQHNRSDAPISTTAAAQAASMGLELSSKVLYQVSLSHFREPMRTNFLQLQTSMRMVLFPLLRLMDPALHAHLYGCGMEPFFALSWLLTWFSHDIRDTALVKRLFDFFLVSHPLMPMYLSIAMLCHPSNRTEILSTPCEFAELHSCLAGLPKNSSMVGWKYRVGDGYVSDDDEIGDGETTSISLDSDMTSHEPGSTRGPSLLSGNEGMMRREDLILSEDHTHVVSMGIPAHVPFQELMDTAISFMRRVPPRKLLAVASRYFDPVQAEPMFVMYPSISLFHHPPSWALARTAKADWVLKQRTRERMGLKARSRKDRKALGELRHRNNATTERKNGTTVTKPAASNQKANGSRDVEEICTPAMVEKSAKQLKYPKAMIAQGFGPGEDVAARRKKRRKLLMVGGAATVAVIAIVIGANMHFKRQTRLQQLEQFSSSVAESPKMTQRKDVRTAREEAMSYVKSTGSPDKGTVQATTQNLSSTSRNDMPTSTISKPDESQGKKTPAKRSPPVPSVKGDDADKSALQKVAINQLKLLSAKVRLLVRTLGVLKASLNDPALRENLQKGLSQFRSQLARKIALLNDSKALADLRTAVVNRMSLAFHNVPRYAVRFLKFTFRQAREHLGGDDLEDLQLL